MVTTRVADPDPHKSGLIGVAGSGSRRAKTTNKKKKVKKFHVLNCWMFSFQG
jgi:hypothetical protein